METLLQRHKKGRLFVMSGPSGVGKDTLIDLLVTRTPGIMRSVSATTRKPRATESDGRDYHFVSHAAFARDIGSNLFLEYEKYGDNFYGTPIGPVQENLDNGNDVILKIEVKGALNVRRLFPDVRLIFIAPPSVAELERRLRLRNTDTLEAVNVRMEIAQAELKQAIYYDYIVVNDILENAVQRLECIITAERLRV